jgi:hypothetical protein
MQALFLYPARPRIIGCMFAATVRVWWEGDKFDAALKKELADRIERVGEVLKTGIQKNLSTSGTVFTPSGAGELPHAVTTRLRGAIQSKPLRRELKVYVGVPDGPLGDIAYWLEFGTEGPVEIKPVNAKALMIPITADQAEQIMSNPKLYKRGKSGKIIKAGNSKRKLMRRAGIVTYRGNLYLLRSFVRRGPMAQRSFLRRTLEEMKPELLQIMCAKLPGNVGGKFRVTSWVEPNTKNAGI